MHRFSPQGLLVPPSGKVHHQKGFHWLNCFPWNNYREQSKKRSPARAVPLLQKYALPLALLSFTLFLFSCPQPVSNTEPRTAVLLAPADLTILLSYENHVELKWTDLNDSETAYVVTRDDKILKTLPANTETFLDETWLEYESDAPNLEGGDAHTYGVYAVDADGTKSDSATVARGSMDNLITNSLSLNYPHDEIFPEVIMDRENQDIIFQHIPRGENGAFGTTRIYLGRGSSTGREILSIASGSTAAIAKFSLYETVLYERNVDGSYTNTSGSWITLNTVDRSILFTPNKSDMLWVLFTRIGIIDDASAVTFHHPKSLPSAVIELAASVTEGTANLTWTAGAVTGTDPEENPAAGFVIQANNTAQDWVTIDYVTSPSFSDTEYSPGTSYRVAAVNNGGRGEYTEITPAR